MVMHTISGHCSRGTEKLTLYLSSKGVPMAMELEVLDEEEAVIVTTSDPLQSLSPVFPEEKPKEEDTTPWYKKYWWLILIFVWLQVSSLSQR